VGLVWWVGTWIAYAGPPYTRVNTYDPVIVLNSNMKISIIGDAVYYTCIHCMSVKSLNRCGGKCSLVRLRCNFKTGDCYIIFC